MFANLVSECLVSETSANKREVGDKDEFSTGQGKAGQPRSWGSSLRSLGTVCPKDDVLLYCMFG